MFANGKSEVLVMPHSGGYSCGSNFVGGYTDAWDMPCMRFLSVVEMSRSRTTLQEAGTHSRQHNVPS